MSSKPISRFATGSSKRRQTWPADEATREAMSSTRMVGLLMLLLAVAALGVCLGAMIHWAR